jgi:hypothetical protein
MFKVHGSGFSKQPLNLKPGTDHFRYEYGKEDEK